MVLAAFILISASPAPTATNDCAWIYEKVGKPQANSPSSNHELCRRGFILSFNQTTGVPDWVMERLTPSVLVGAADRKHSRFKRDPDLNKSPGLSDYRKSGYDRGHMAPAANMKWDQAAMDESFYFSNMAPQVGPGFNRGIWARLEAKIRDWTKERGDLIVITGPVYYDYLPVIGNGIVVPDAFYKIIYSPSQHQALALILPNRKITAKDFTPHQVTIDQVEALTGYDFLSNLPSLAENETTPLWP